MKVLIIGGTGLISTAITREMLEKDYEVTLYNRGQREARFPAGAQQITGDRYDFPTFERQMAEAGRFDCVIEMIGFKPEQAESAVRAFRGRTDHLVFCSTVDVYRKPAGRLPVTEAEPRIGNNDYGRNKILCEDIFTQAHQRGDFNATIIRPAMSYGEGGTVVEPFGWGTRYIDRLRKGKPIIVHGDGTCLWVACHVDDVAHAFVHAAGNAATYGKAYHVTGEEWLTWNRYFSELAEAAGAPPPQFAHIPTDVLLQLLPQKASIIRENFGENSIYDNTAAKTDLDFRYTVSWKEGARRTIRWLDTHDRIQPTEDDARDDRIIAAWENLRMALAREFKMP